MNAREALLNEMRDERDYRALRDAVPAIEAEARAELLAELRVKASHMGGIRAVGSVDFGELMVRHAAVAALLSESQDPEEGAT